MIACGFGVAANFYPKLEMTREPRGPFGRMVDKVYRDVSLFENDMYDVKNDTDTECVPYAGLDDVLNSQGGKHMGNIFTRYHIHLLRNHQGKRRVQRRPKISTYKSKNLQKSPEMLSKCPEMSRNVQKCPEMSRNVQKCPEMFFKNV